MRASRRCRNRRVPRAATRPPTGRQPSSAGSACPRRRLRRRRAFRTSSRTWCRATTLIADRTNRSRCRRCLGRPIRLPRTRRALARTWSGSSSRSTTRSSRPRTPRRRRSRALTRSSKAPRRLRSSSPSTASLRYPRTSRSRSGRCRPHLHRRSGALRHLRIARAVAPPPCHSGRGTIYSCPTHRRPRRACSRRAFSSAVRCSWRRWLSRCSPSGDARDAEERPSVITLRRSPRVARRMTRRSARTKTRAPAHVARAPALRRS